MVGDDSALHPEPPSPVGSLVFTWDAQMAADGCRVL